MTDTVLTTVVGSWVLYIIIVPQLYRRRWPRRPSKAVRAVAAIWFYANIVVSLATVVWLAAKLPMVFYVSE